MLKGHQEASPYTAGPGLVALAADGESLKRLLELVPTFRAHLTLRCVDSDRMGYDAVFNYPSASDAMLAHMKSEYSDEAWCAPACRSVPPTACLGVWPPRLPWPPAQLSFFAASWPRAAQVL